jgi:hypothetical protein
MLITVIGVGSLIVLVIVGLYLRKYSRSHQVLSTTDWVKLMRENDARIDSRTKRTAVKRRPPEAHA